MGTRSLTNIYQRLIGADGPEDSLLVTIYRQFDGYPEGMGADIAGYLAGKVIRNGYSPDDSLETAFNGAGCLAAALIGHLKEEIGNVYIQEPGATDCWEEYVYDIMVVPPTEAAAPKGEGTVRIRCSTPDGEVLFEGTPEEMLGWAESQAVGV